MSNQTVSTLRHGWYRETPLIRQLVWNISENLRYREDHDQGCETSELQDRQIADLLQDITFGQPPAEVWERIKQRAEQICAEYVSRN
jgi:hypothetical protein